MGLDKEQATTESSDLCSFFHSSKGLKILKG